MIHCRSSKQKLKAKSSTEAEVLGKSDYILCKMWMLMILEEQGCVLRKRVVYQDNQSAIRMEKNGRNSCTGNFKHIDIRCFFVKDRFVKGEFDIEHCPTLEMLVCYFTKPSQGTIFHVFRNIIMGHAHVETIRNIKSVLIKERVGSMIKLENENNNARVQTTPPSQRTLNQIYGTIQIQ